MVFLQILAVGTRTHVEPVHPRTAHQFDEVLVALIVLRQHNEMVTALMALIVLERLGAIARHIHLATEDGLERFQSFLFATFVHTVHIVMELLDAKHVAVIGNGHTLHAVGYSFVYQPFDARLSVENRIVCMDV